MRGSAAKSVRAPDQAAPRPCLRAALPFHARGRACRLGGRPTGRRQRERQRPHSPEWRSARPRRRLPPFGTAQSRPRGRTSPHRPPGPPHPPACAARPPCGAPTRVSIGRQGPSTSPPPLPSHSASTFAITGRPSLRRDAPCERLAAPHRPAPGAFRHGIPLVVTSLQAQGAGAAAQVGQERKRRPATARRAPRLLGAGMPPASAYPPAAITTSWNIMAISQAQNLPLPPPASFSRALLL